MSKPNGGPAFPGGINSVYTDLDEGEPTQAGMTLRDYFAAAALQGFMVNNNGRFTPTQDAGYCYKIADAMLEARNA